MANTKNIPYKLARIKNTPYLCNVKQKIQLPNKTQSNNCDDYFKSSLHKQDFPLLGQQRRVLHKYIRDTETQRRGTNKTYGHSEIKGKQRPANDYYLLSLH